MKASTTITVIISLIGTLSAQAHDPSEHADKAEKPRCKALKGMDPETMDRDDPVVQALLKKCEKQLHKKQEPKHGGEHNGKND